MGAGFSIRSCRLCHLLHACHIPSMFTAHNLQQILAASCQPSKVAPYARNSVRHPLPRPACLTPAECRFTEFEALRDTFYIRDGASWRAPRVNETCCRRPQLAAFLDAIGAQGPVATFQQHAEVSTGFSLPTHAPSSCSLL